MPIRTLAPIASGVIGFVLRKGAPPLAVGLVLGGFAAFHALFAAEPVTRQAAAIPASFTGASEWVSFGDSRLPAVRVVRGTGMLPRATSTEIVSFGPHAADVVKVVRGITPGPPSAGIIGRSEARPAAAKLLRTLSDDAAALFAPAGVGELDRIAFAVDGIESRHGADLRMWRAEPLGPQGPMQVSAAAASDVGGGNRFDLRENRLLGRAYLARMFRRYGNWSDALAAYNWGPGNLDAWIGAGRPTARLPDEVARYVALVLRDALITLARW